MRSEHPIEMAAVACVLLAGGILFARMIVLSDAVPAEYRSASPGFGWSWDFDYDDALRNSGRLGAEPWPWPAKQTGDRLVLPLNQPLVSGGLEITYRGMMEPGSFRLDVVIHDLDSGVTYVRDFDVREARHGMMVSDRQFRLEKITSRYLRLRSAVQ